LSELRENPKNYTVKHSIKDMMIKAVIEKTALVEVERWINGKFGHLMGVGSIFLLNKYYINSENFFMLLKFYFVQHVLYKLSL
jgi:hypothetical protein